MQKKLLRLTALLLGLAAQYNSEVRAQTLDPTFAAIDLRQPAAVTDALQQPDGKIVAVGTFTQVNGTSAIGLARLNTDGTLDQVFTTAGASQAVPSKVRRFANGQLLLAGYTVQVGGSSFPTLAKLNADGMVRKLLVQANGRIVVAGAFQVAGGKRRRTWHACSPTALPTIPSPVRAPRSATLRCPVFRP